MYTSDHFSIQNPLLYIGLLYQLTKRQIIARYRGSLLGLGWAILSPLLMIVTYTFIFKFVLNLKWPDLGTGQTNFGLNIFSGLIIFNLFADVLLRSPNLIREQPNFVQKIVFPLHIINWAQVTTALINQVPSIILLFIFCLIMHISPNLRWLTLPIIWSPLIPLLLGISFLLSSLGVFIRDLSQIVGFLVSLLQFLSPIFYPVTVIPEKYRDLFFLNPLTLIIDNTRLILFSTGPIHYLLVGFELIISIIFLQISIFIFNKLKRGFADVL